MDVMEAIITRRSIRRYKPDPVDEKDLKTVLEAARLAPSWGNKQCWRFIVVRDNKVKDKLADSLVKVEIGGEPADNPSIRAIRNVPVVIVACGEKGKSGYEFGRPITDKGDFWYMYDVALAMENMALAAHSLGLGMVTIAAMNSGRIDGILGIPEGFCTVSLALLGYPDQEPKARPRKDLSEIVFYDRYGAAGS